MTTSVTMVDEFNKNILTPENLKLDTLEKLEICNNIYIDKLQIVLEDVIKAYSIELRNNTSYELRAFRVTTQDHVDDIFGKIEIEEEYYKTGVKVTNQN